MAFITIDGEHQIAKKQGDNETLNIATFVLANITDLGEEPATRIESIPNAEFISDQLSVTKSGYVSTNQVVYSLVMGSDIGDYEFNWVGMVDDEGVLIAVSYIPTIQKIKNNGGVPGNTITRNFLLAYTGIQQTTAITVPAETWQIDFTARLSGIDERERLSNFDIYGHEGFLGDGWLVTESEVTESGGAYSVAAGVGYVGGIRVTNEAEQEITTATFPNEIWLNVSLQGDISDMTAVGEFVIDTGPFEEYIDGNGVAHYLTRLAEIDGAGDVVDARPASEVEKINQDIDENRESLILTSTMINTLSLQLSTSFAKLVVSEPAFQLDSGTLKTVADLGVAVGGSFYSYDESAGLVMPASMTLGTDYAIYATPDGLVVSANFTVPDGYTALTSRRIGGFHYQDGVINEYSIYDVKYKPSVRDPRGMVRSPLGIWGDIYLLNTSPEINGTSAYNVTIADGSSPPKVPVIWGGDGTAQYDDFSQYTAARMLAAYGKRLPSSHEFEQLAFGSVTGYAVGTDPVTTKFDASAKSMVGCEQVSGHMWQWGSERWDRGNGSSGYAWYGADTNSEGQVYTAGSSGVGASRFGGYWDDSGIAGSRASNWSNEPWSSTSTLAARGVCDHFES